SGRTGRRSGTEPGGRGVPGAARSGKEEPRATSLEKCLDSGAPGGDSTHTVRVLFYYRGIENLGVGYLMSMLKHHGHTIDLIFDPGFDDNLYLKAPHLAWLNRHEALRERAVAFKPDLVAMGVLTNLWPFAKKMAEKLKATIGVPIVVGGHHAQALPDYILQNPDVDMVCIGEGEIGLLELVNRME